MAPLLPRRPRETEAEADSSLRDGDANPSVGQQALRNRVGTLMTVVISHDLRKQVLVRNAVPDPVVKPVAGNDVVMLARNEIAEDVGSLVIGESEVLVKHGSCRRRHLVL